MSCDTSAVNTATISGCDGGSIVVADVGARVLRLVSHSGYDFLWLNDALVRDEEDVEPYSFGWKNYGGDRTWIAPEPDFFWSDSNDIAGTYRVPDAFDPGKYQMESGEDGIRLFSTFEIENIRLGEICLFRQTADITKQLAIPLPLSVKS